MLISFYKNTETNCPYITLLALTACSGGDSTAPDQIKHITWMYLGITKYLASNTELVNPNKLRQNYEISINGYKHFPHDRLCYDS